MTQSTETAADFGRRTGSQGPVRRALRAFIHFFSYHLFLKRNRRRRTRAAGFRLTIGPTVFHPRVFLTSEFFAGVIDRLNLQGKRVADVGTGTGVLALAAARAGAAEVVAIDINPNAVEAAGENARVNGLGERVRSIRSDLLSAVPLEPKFDVIISNPPLFPLEPRDIADRAWHCGPDYRDILALFDQARERLANEGVMYVLLSSDCDLEALGGLMQRAGFDVRLAAERSIMIESFLIYELRQRHGFTG